MVKKFGILLLLVGLAACYPRKHEVVTYYVGPGEGAHVVFYDHNIRLYPPENEDPKKIGEYQQNFLSDDHLLTKQLKSAGAVNLNKKIIKRTHPLATALSAEFSKLESLVNFWKIQLGGSGRIVLTADPKFVKLEIEILDKEEAAIVKPNEGEPSNVTHFMHSLTKFVFEGSKIKEARGFLVTDENMTAVFDTESVLRELREKKKSYLSLTWVPLTQ